VFSTLKPNEDEPPLDPKYMKSREADDELTEEDTKETNEMASEKEFTNQPASVLKEAKTFKYNFANKKQDPIHWKIHAIDDDVDDCLKFEKLKQKLQDGPTINGDLDFEGMNYTEFFFLICGRA
jgi:hypothetical protein